MPLYRCPVLLALVCSLWDIILNFHKRLAHRNGQESPTACSRYNSLYTIATELISKKLHVCINFKIQRSYGWQKPHTMLGPVWSIDRPCCKIFSIQHIPKTQGEKYHCTCYASVDVPVHIQSCFSLPCCALYQRPTTTITEGCLPRLDNGTPHWKGKNIS